MVSITTALIEAEKKLQPASESPLLDAEILLCKVLEKRRSYLRTWPELELTDGQQRDFLKLLQKRQHGQPIAYLTGTKEFWSRDFIVTPDVLIPRPETELLIELSLDLLPPTLTCKILDLGTGSGIIAIILAKERPKAEVFACDNSPAALTVAQLNAKQHGINTINFIESCWFDAIPPHQYDLIVSNPPYIAPSDPHLSSGDVRFEPQAALISEKQGLTDIEHIVAKSHNWLKSGAFIMLEHGYNQQKDVQAIFKRHGYLNIDTFPDLAGQPRLTRGQFFS